MHQRAMSSSPPPGGGGGRRVVGHPSWVVVLGILALTARLTVAAQNLRHLLADSDENETPSTITDIIDDLVGKDAPKSDEIVEDTGTAAPASTSTSKTEQNNLRRLAGEKSSPTDMAADDVVEPDFMYWVTPIASLGLTCGGASIKSRDGQYVCIKAGEALCQDNDGGPFGRWTFGITEDNQVNLWTPKNEIAWTFCTDVSHVCIGEERDPRPDKFSNERPYLYFYDEKTQQTVGNLTCDGTDGFKDENIGKPTILKMVDNSDVGMYANYNITVLKFKKGQTPDPGDSNELFNITVDMVGQDMVGSMSFKDSKCTWTDVCVDEDEDEVVDEHELNGPDAFDEDGNFLANFFQGDMLVTFSQVVAMLGDERATELLNSGFVFLPEDENGGLNRAITDSEDKRWPEGNRYKNTEILVPYEFSDGMDAARQLTIQEGIKLVEETQAVRFINAAEFEKHVKEVEAEGKQSTLANHFIRFFRQDRVADEDSPTGFRNVCASSYVGLYKGGCNCESRTDCTCQRITLGFSFPQGCGNNPGSVAHEIMHALGFHHEHSRSDRQTFVMINWPNIEDGMGNNNFWEETDSVSLGTSYDYGSIMHYHNTAFNTNGMRTIDITAVGAYDPFITQPGLLGQRQALSNTDLQQLRLLYQCSTGAKNVSEFTECSKECPCFENAPYKCETDDECHEGLLCSERIEDLMGRLEPFCRNQPTTRGCEVEEPAQPDYICMRSPNEIYRNDFETINPNLPTQFPQCNRSAFFNIDALYTPTGIPPGFPFEEKPGTNFEALVLNAITTSGEFVFAQVNDVDGVRPHEHALGGFSTDYVGVDGVPKEDALALTKIPIDFPYVEVSVKLAAANLPPSECGGPFPYEEGVDYQAELHVALSRRSRVDWNDLEILDECVIIGNIIDGGYLASPPEYILDWKRDSCILDADGVTGGQGSLIFYFKGDAPYQVFDDLVVDGLYEAECVTDDDCPNDSICNEGTCVRKGNPRFTLTWFGDDDLDIHAIPPGGEEIYYDNKVDPVTGGNLDEDRIPDRLGWWTENINVPTGPDGTYTVWVDQYDQVGGPDPFQLLFAEDANEEEPGEIIYTYYGSDGLSQGETSPFFSYSKPGGVVTINYAATAGVQSSIVSRANGSEEKLGKK